MEEWKEARIWKTKIDNRMAISMTETGRTTINTDVVNSHGVTATSMTESGGMIKGTD